VTMTMTMTTAKTKELPAKVPSQLDTDLTSLSLHFMAEHHSELANRAVRESWGHIDYLTKLTEGELNLRDCANLKLTSKTVLC